MNFNADRSDGAELRLRLTADGGVITAVGIENRRPLALLAGLRGRDADSLPEVLRHVFPICGWAHAIACRRAVRAARGLPLTDQEAAESDFLWAELAVAHAWRHLVDWRSLLERPPKLAALRDVMARGEELRASVRDRAARRGALAALARSLEVALFGAEPPPDAQPETLLDWAGSLTGPAGHLLAAVAASPLAEHAWPRGPLQSLGAGASGSPPWFEARLREDPAFGRLPVIDGQPAEVGAWAACPPASRAVLRGRGPVAARFFAMLAAGADLVSQLRAAARGSERLTVPCVASNLAASGCGVAETVRGPLAYWVRLSGERVAEVRSVAPTEWVAHPRGGLVRLLPGLPSDDGPRLARWAAAAFDPCATLAVEMAETAHA